MARKKLLSEGEIRQFMKLANLRPVGQERLSEMGGKIGMSAPGARDDMPEMDDEEDDSPMGGDMSDDPMGDDPMGDDPEPMPEPEPMGMDDDPGEGGRAEELVMSISQELEELAGLAGVDVEVSRDEGEPEPMADLPPVGDDDDELPGGRDYDGMMEEVVRRLSAKMAAPEKAAKKDVDTDQIVAEVAARVARRLQKNDRKEELAEQLAERIMKRLTK